MPRVLELRRARPHPPEEAPPDALEEVERVEPRPQQPGQLPADDQPDLRLVAGQQLVRRRLVARPDPAEERPQLRPRPVLGTDQRPCSLPPSSPAGRPEGPDPAPPILPDEVENRPRERTRRPATAAQIPMTRQ